MRARARVLRRAETRLYVVSGARAAPRSIGNCSHSFFSRCSNLAPNRPSGLARSEAVVALHIQVVDFRLAHDLQEKVPARAQAGIEDVREDRKSTRLNSSH